MSSSRHRSVLISSIVAVAAACLIVALVSTVSSGSSDDRADASPFDTSVADETSDAPTATDSVVAPIGSDAPASTATLAGVDVSDGEDLVGADPATVEECTITERSLDGGSSGSSVVCLQEALREAGFYAGAITGVYDNATAAAVEKVQVERNLYVDGKVGRETALSLGIWPDEQSLVVRTPPPAPGAVDSMGFPLSSVASTGADAPPLPENSGTGRRVVYSRAGQRVWAIDENENVIRSWLVSGSQYDNELPGTHEVYSRSEVSTAWNGKAFLPKMIRWLRTDIGHIGFHAIPLRRADRTPYQTEAELGTRLSGGCQRQANADADFMWEFAQVGTKVVVV